MVVPAQVNTNALTGLVIRIIAKLLVAAIVVFVLTRVISPMLMDVRSNLAFWAGVVCWPLALVVAVLAAAWVRDDVRTFRRLRGAPIRLSGPD